MSEKRIFFFVQDWKEDSRCKLRFDITLECDIMHRPELTS